MGMWKCLNRVQLKEHGLKLAFSKNQSWKSISTKHRLVEDGDVISFLHSGL